MAKIEFMEMSKVLPNRPDLDSRKTDWKLIGLESYSLPTGQTPEFSISHYAVSLNPQGFQAKCWLDGQVDREEVLPEGIMVCPPDISYQFDWDRPIKAINLNLASSLLTHSAVDLLKTNRVDLSFQVISCDTLIYSMGLALKADLMGDRPGGRIYAETLANALAVHLLRHYSCQKHLTKSLQGRLSPQQVRLIVEFIDVHLSDDLGLEELASLVELSPSYFCRAFKQTLGMPPHRYVIQQRVERAKQLLKQENFSLSEVAFLCGFSHQSHLNRHFKRLTGMTPKKFAKS